MGYDAPMLTLLFVALMVVLLAGGSLAMAMMGTRQPRTDNRRGINDSWMHDTPI